MDDWNAHAEREIGRYRDGEARLPGAADADARQRQLTRMGNAAGGAGLALLMQGRHEYAAEWLARAAERYRESFAGAPAESWGRPIGALKARLLARDRTGAKDEARWTLDLGAAGAPSPIGRYAACLSLLALERWKEACPLADGLRTHEGFPAAVGDALAMIAAEDPLGYVEAIEAVLESFETREEFLEDVPVADTVLVLQELAGRRGMAAALSSPRLPRP
ncbi:MAG: hypothetical protein H0T39_00610 [Actinobacteria bacterium]|nr:hypothetical protein [Actinomycetota bacterium]